MTGKRDETKNQPISLHPLTPEQALKKALSTPVRTDKAKSAKKRRSK